MLRRIASSRLVAAILTAFFVFAARPAVAAETVDISRVPQVNENAQQRNARMQWWRDAKFGLFLHWGPVSISGRELSWGRFAPRPHDIWHGASKGNGDKYYDSLYKQFNPKLFNADQWVKIAQDAGMKYMVFICKHHDGFSMYDSKLTEYDIMATPYGRDILKQFTDACHKAGMRVGLYYSTRDWYHPDYLVGDNKKYDAFYRGQVEELLTNYGKVDVMWFDHVGGRGWNKWDFPGLFAMMYRHHPELIVNNRACAFCGDGQVGDRVRPTPIEEKIAKGDFGTPEQAIGNMDVKHNWESCMTLVGGQWSWRPGGRMYSLDETVRMLVSCVTGGGNLLLNVGPMPSGEIEDRQVKLLKQVGDWIKPRSEAIYATRGGPLRNGGWGGSSHRGNTIYLFVKEWKGDAVNFYPAPIKVTAARKAVGGKAVEFKQTGNKLEVKLPAVERDPMYTVIALTLESEVPDGSLW